MATATDEILDDSSVRPMEQDEHGTDVDLLSRFLEGDASESEAAFQALVARHGPMVLGVCRNILDRIHDAEDAFQATFLVLAKNAATLRDRRLVGCWLYEVAYRIALRARNRSERRRTQEMEAAEMLAGEPGTESDPSWSELRPVLHEEVNRLPEKYRSAVVLCYLEGRTNEEAAALLDWPVGTVKGRLSRARDLLRSRLTRRGLVFSAAFLSSCLSRNTVFAECVPSRLARETSRHAVLVSRGGDQAIAGLSPTLADMIRQELIGGAIRKVLPARTWIGLGSVLAFVLLAGGIGYQMRRFLPANPGAYLPASLSVSTPDAPVSACHTPPGD